MVNDRVHPAPRRMPGCSLLFALLVSWNWVGLIPAQSGQGDTASKQAAPAAKTKPSEKKATSPSPVPVAGKEKPAKKRTTKPAPTKTAERKQPASTTKPGPAIIGHRDPFKVPQPGRPGEGIEEIKGPLPPGTRGLVISQLRLEGIVRQDLTNTMIAVVVPINVNRAYFLREKDAVYNGVVSKITPDSIYFSENYLSQFGEVKVREVVKRLGSAPGEGR